MLLYRYYVFYFILNMEFVVFGFHIYALCFSHYLDTITWFEVRWYVTRVKGWNN